MVGPSGYPTTTEGINETQSSCIHNGSCAEVQMNTESAHQLKSVCAVFTSCSCFVTFHNSEGLHNGLWETEYQIH